MARKHARTDEIRELFEKEALPPRMGWTVEGLLPCGFLAILAGRPKEGKTCLAAALGQAVAAGTPFAGMRTSGQRVMYFAAEESAQEWAHAILPYLPPERDGLMVAHTPNLRIDDEADLWGLRVNVGRYRAGLIIVDPLLAACESGDFASPLRARNALTGLKQLCALEGFSALVVHHAKERAGRAHRVAESPQLAATASLNLVMNQRSVEGGRIVTLEKSGRGDFAHGRLELFSPGPCRYERHGPP